MTMAPMGNTPEAFTVQVKADSARRGKVIRDRGIKVDQRMPTASNRGRLIRETHTKGDIMQKLIAQFFYSSLLALVFAAPAVYAADINREWVDFTPPAEIKWVKNPSGNNESAILPEEKK